MKEITIKPNYKHRVPFKPTQVHRNKKKYIRIGKNKVKHGSLYKDGDYLYFVRTE